MRPSRGLQLAILFSLIHSPNQFQSYGPETQDSPPISLRLTSEPHVSEMRLVILSNDANSSSAPSLKELHLTEDKTERKLLSLEGGPSSPLTIGFFFDLSRSRRNDRHAKEELKEATHLLRSLWAQGVSAFVIGFNDTPELIAEPTRVLENVIAGLDQVAEIHPGGSTALYDAVCAPKPEILARFRGRKAFVVFGDFEDNSSQHSFEAMLKRAAVGGVQVFPILLGTDFTMGPSNKKMLARGRKIAQTLAEETGGEVFEPETGKDLPAVFQRLRVALENSYSLRFEASDSSNKPRKKFFLTMDHPQTTLVFSSPAQLSAPFTKSWGY